MKNRGEWAELFVFIYCVYKQQVYIMDLKRYLKILEIEFLMKGRKVNFKLLENKIIISPEDEFSFEYLLDVSMSGKVDQARQEILNGKGRSFDSPTTTMLLENLRYYPTKASSGSKKDTSLLLETKEKRGAQGISIKAMDCGRPTLLNSTAPNRFLYNLEIPYGKTVSLPRKGSWIGGLVRNILQSGIVLKESIPRETWRENLKQVNMDRFFPSIYIEGLLTRGRKIPKVLKNYIELHQEVNHGRLITSTKNFLLACATGMVAGTDWDGSIDTPNFFITVYLKDEKNTVRIHTIDDINLIKNDLFSNTALDTADAYKDGIKILGESKERPYKECQRIFHKDVIPLTKDDFPNRGSIIGPGKYVIGIEPKIRILNSFGRDI